MGKQRAEEITAASIKMYSHPHDGNERIAFQYGAEWAIEKYVTPLESELSDLRRERDELKAKLDNATKLNWQE